jgi:hypothetical protein
MSDRVFRMVSGGLALVSLGVCLAAPVFFFLGRIAERTYKTGFLLATIAWFILATAWASSARKKSS